MQLSEYVRFNALFDTYGSLLTDRQHSVVFLHICEDLSLSETADELGITKQAVSDALLTARAKLEEYESKVHMLETVQRLSDIASKLKKTDGLTDEANALIGELTDILKSYEEE